MPSINEAARHSLADFEADLSAAIRHHAITLANGSGLDADNGTDRLTIAANMQATWYQAFAKWLNDPNERTAMRIAQAA